MTCHVDSSANNTIISYTFTQHSFQQGMWKSPEEGKAATILEMKQLHNMQLFQPVNKEDLTKQEMIQVLNSLIFLKQKQCWQLKA
jgi:hypothetical protein